MNNPGEHPLPARSHPAHPSPVSRPNESAILFVTLCTTPRGLNLNNESTHAAFLQACREADHWRVGRYVIMPDHIHLFCAPSDYAMPTSIKKWAIYLKRLITRHIPHPCWSWQSDVWDTQLRSRIHYEEKWEYVIQNPVRGGLVTHPSDWPWMGEIHVLQW